MTERMTETKLDEIMARAMCAARLIVGAPGVADFRPFLDESEEAIRALVQEDVPAMVDEIERLRADAGRYRFLRDNELGFRAVDGNASVPPHPDVMDRWVDDAIEQSHPAASAADNREG